MSTGTIFENMRPPLTVWLIAAWYLTCAKNGVAATTLQRFLGLNPYQTAWTMLHRFRTVMVRPHRNPLTGEVEVDGVFYGAAQPDRRGRGPAGVALALVAVDRHPPRGFGRCRPHLVADASAASIRQFPYDFVEPGSTIVTDGLASYLAAAGKNWAVPLANLAASSSDASQELPAVHRLASLLKRWLQGTLQGAVQADHPQSYLDEFTFWFNRRRWRFRGLLFYRLWEQSVAAQPTSYRALVAAPKTGRPQRPLRPPTPPPLRRWSVLTCVPPLAGPPCTAQPDG